MDNYKKNITVNKPVSEVYAAITEHIQDWWSNDLIGAAVNAGDSFTISFGKTQKTFEILEVAPNERVVWKCVKAYIDMAILTNKAEWEGTKLIWKISPHSAGTTIYFLHEGLTPDFECYNVCEAGWDTFLTSLQTYLNTGKGLPYQKPM
jgi:uncharacterized protein YndB with AHSA1/START domain